MGNEQDWRDMSRWGANKEYPDPTSVRQQLTGGGADPSGEWGSRDLGDRAPEGAGQMARELFESGLSNEGERPDLIVITPGFDEETEILKDVAALVERCPTCGRMFDCACPNCQSCGVGGRPRKVELDSTEGGG